MIYSPPARVTIACCAFFLLFLLTGSGDVSLAVAAAVFLLLSRVRFIYPFGVAAAVFILSLMIDALDLDIPLIHDGELDAYIFLVTGMMLYLCSRTDFMAWLSRNVQRETEAFSPTSIRKFIASCVFGLLLSPLTGGSIAAIVAYGLFSFLIRRFNGKIAIILAVTSVCLAALFFLFQVPGMAEEVGNYAFFFFAVGTIQELFRLIWQSSHQASWIKKEETSPRIKTGLLQNIPSARKYLRSGLLGLVLISGILAFLLVFLGISLTQRFVFTP